MSHDEVPRDVSPRHYIVLVNGAWSCECGARSVPGITIGAAVRSAAAHERNPEAEHGQ